MYLQITIIEVLDLIGKSYSGMSNPFVEIEVLGIKKKTRFQKKTVSCVYDETFYFNFEGKFCEKEEILFKPFFYANKSINLV